MNNDLPLGGKAFILGGDFRQVAPVVSHASKTKIIENCIKSGKIWDSFSIIKLNTNMRADPNEKAFAEYILQLGAYIATRKNKGVGYGYGFETHYHSRPYPMYDTHFKTRHPGVRGF